MNNMNIHGVVKIEVERTCEHWKHFTFRTCSGYDDFQITVFSDKWLPITRIPDSKEDGEQLEGVKENGVSLLQSLYFSSCS